MNFDKIPSYLIGICQLTNYERKKHIFILHLFILFFCFVFKKNIEIKSEQKNLGKKSFENLKITFEK